MLRNFTKTKPKRDDNLPEKVCLNCISEIIRCYSFKMKCENSNRTLRQMLPDAVPEELDEIPNAIVNQIKKCNKLVQTQTITKKTINIGVQTMKMDKSEHHHNRHVQTEQLETASIATSPIVPEVITYDELNKNVELQRILQVDLTADSGGDGAEFIKVKRRYDTRSLAKRNVGKRRKFDIQEIELTQENESIILQLQNDTVINEVEVEDPTSEGVDYNEEQYENAATQSETEEGNDEELNDDNDGSYYEIEGINIVTTDGDDKHETTYNAEDIVEFKELIYTDEMENDSESAPVYNFTIQQSEFNNETKIVVKRPTETQPTTATSRSNNNKVEYKCSECIMSFYSKNNLKRHILKRHGLTIVQESEKGSANKITTIKQSREHLRREKNVASSLKAETGSQSSGSQEEKLDRELIKVAVQSIESTPKPLQFFCERCNAGFAMRKSLNYHIKLNLCTVKSYVCNTCDRVFITAEQLSDHKATHVLANVCNECNKVFETKLELSQHLIDDHNRSIKNQCEICKKVFTMFSALKDHMRTHSGEKPYLCTMCGKGFSQNANLKQHLMRHSKEKKFKCDECTNSYVTKAELYSHKRTHTGDQPYKCEVCDARFTTLSSLVKHKRKHTGERPYACDICPMRFSALNVLKNHRRTHTGEKPYKCIFCEKCFTQRGDCQIHQRTHTGERNYVCFCGERFTHLGTLRTHKKVHKMDNDDKKSDNEDGTLFIGLEEVAEENDEDGVKEEEQILEVTMENIC